MAFIDEVKFFAQAGRGGDGVVRWRREKFKPKGGPSGGDGGRGGDFIIEGTRDITVLRKVAQKDSYKAEDGEPGEKNSMHGADGEDFVLRLPIGALVTNVLTGETIELMHDGEQVVLLHGGAGGYGNEHFKSSINQKPMQATKGEDGEEGNYRVELRLIADVGLVGLPNAGKTSLLNILTNAGARVGDYPFTTLDPNLGVYYKFVIADIPGLIEGASEGKGLGQKFLRHISRTNVILHCISLEREYFIEDYMVVRKELESYPEVKDKQEYIVLTKSDIVSKEVAFNVRDTIEKTTKKKVIGIVSVIDDLSIKEFGDALVSILKEDEKQD